MLSQIEQILLLLGFFCLMIGIGSSIETSDIKALAKERSSVFLGLSLQYLLLPSLAFTLTLTLGLSPLIGGTLLLIASCPGGSTSNMFTYFSKGNVSLSLFLTLLTTLGAVIMTPFLLYLFGSKLTQSALSIPLKNLVATLGVALVPVILGFAIRLKSKNWALKVEKVGSRIGYFSIATMIVLWFPKTLEILQNQNIKVFIAAGSLSFLGILGSLWISKAFLRPSQIARTLSFETGIQNAPLAFAMITLNLPKELALEIGWVPLLYGALSVGNAILFTVIYRIIDRKSDQQKLC